MNCWERLALVSRAGPSTLPVPILLGEKKTPFLQEGFAYL